MSLRDTHLRIKASALAVIAVAGCGNAANHIGYAATIDIVECRPDYEDECVHFYENNWKVFREEALKRNFISGYQLLRADADSSLSVTLFLVTEYPDSVTFALMEENFQPMMMELRPEGPSLLNDVSRGEFVMRRTAFTARPLNSM